MVIPIGITLALPLYQPILLLLRPSESVLRHAVVTVINVAVGALILLLLPAFGITPVEAGIEAFPSALTRALAWGGPVAIVIVLGSAIAFRNPPVRKFIAVVRVRHLTNRQLLLQVPLIVTATAAFEEVLFRGFLLALWRESFSLPVAVMASSIGFGLWHIAPAWDRARQNDPRATAGAVVMTVAVTTVAGVFLCLLRGWSGGILAGIIVHAAANTCGLLGAWLGWRGPLLDARSLPCPGHRPPV